MRSRRLAALQLILFGGTALVSLWPGSEAWAQGGAQGAERAGDAQPAPPDDVTDGTTGAGPTSPAAAETEEPAGRSEERPATTELGLSFPERTPRYAREVRRGIAYLQAQDPAAAREAFARAVQHEPSAPTAHYYLGVVERRRGQLEASRKAFRIAAERAVRDESPRERARALVALALTEEQAARATLRPVGSAGPSPSAPAREASRTGARSGEPAASLPPVNRQAFEGAKRAWGEVARFAEEQPELVNPEVARARMETIDRLLSRDDAYREVRTRIAERSLATDEDED